MKITKYKEQAIEDFSKPQRLYSDHELQDFHNKIQRFWDAPRELKDVEVFGSRVNGTAQKFRYEDLHVAFGAAKKVDHGTTHVYQYTPERYDQFNNLWKQYEDYRKKKDWIENKNTERLEETAQKATF